ncbi:uncharacterized protein LOC111039946 [Myzus persicae]|uniref:uncharacterized protein LOC111039946 n=1 Tax=Myzus persicae TaxID=13164 RepID=UPI000B930E4D|nr:uncharacterized protein LOC111039946 [Myzus persicae]
MSDVIYNQLLIMLRPFITKMDTNMRDSISANERLAVTLRYLVTGRSFEDLKFSSIISPTTISMIVIETCEAIVTVLKDLIQLPQTPEAWKIVASDFNDKWNFGNCLGAIDGKHVDIKKPPNSGSMYYNYKGIFSIVLMAIVNANYQFTMVDVGANGRISDGGVLYYTKFWEKFENNTLNIPLPSCLPNTSGTYPYVFVSDEAFSLKSNLMKPFSQHELTNHRRIFNYRLSRARRVVENAFADNIWCKRPTQ